MKAELVGAVLAGGRSVRMGGQAKEHMVLPDGRAMIDHVVDALSAVCHEVVVLGKTTARGDLRHLPDLRADSGPLAGIEALLQSGLAESYIVCACDVPRVTGELLSRLIVNEPVGITTTGALPTFLRASNAALVSEMLDEGHRAVWRFVERVEHVKVDVDARLLVNVNTPEEFERLRQP